MGENHAALELAQILGAGDDFLPRIAALLKIHRADQFHVGHLRHELLLGGGRDQR